MESDIDISRALAIDGWMTEDELRWLAHKAQRYQRIVELGSYLGRSTRALADNTPGIVVAVDDWWGARDVHIPYTERRTLYQRFKDNNLDLIQSGKIVPLRLSFEELDNIQFKEPPNMIFIDGDHEYAAVRRDIVWALKSLWPKGGLLCGHDADRISVKQAVRDAFGIRYGVSLGTIWHVDLVLRYGAN